MIEAPSRIWIDPEGTISRVKIISEDVEYIRADIVYEMRRTMVAYMERFPSVFGAPYKVVDDYKKAIKLLEEE